MAPGGDSKDPESGAPWPPLRLPGGEFPLALREIPVSGFPVPLLEVPYTQENLERLAALRGLRERDWPYWLEDWPSTYALAEVLAAEAAGAEAAGAEAAGAEAAGAEGAGAGRPAPWREPVLDLGCGSGFMAAFFLHRFGLRTFSCDFNRDACVLAALNARGLPNRSASGSDRMQSAPPQGGRVFCADFSSFPSRARFGTLLAGEMLYAKENQGPILDFLDRHLLPGGSAWLADPGRSAAEGFRSRAIAAGWRVDVRRVASKAAGRNVDVYRLNRPGDPG
jgi:SAM-dependent methyltransferase